jgi:hypothetical protein
MVLCSIAICPCCPRCCHCASRQGMPDYASKAPSSHSEAIVVGHCHPQCIVCAADVIAITQHGEEQATWQGTTIHAVLTFHRRASLDTPLHLSWSRVTARNAQRCQGTFVCTATTLVVTPVVAWLPLLPPTEKGKEWLTMPRLRCPLCHRLSALPPLSLSRERARNSR